MKLLLGAGSCAVLVGLSGVALCATAAPAQACPYGTVPSHFPGVCESGQSGGLGPNAQVVTPVQAGGAQISGGPGELPRVNGVPCTPQNVGTCIGLMQSQG